MQLEREPTVGMFEQSQDRETLDKRQGDKPRSRSIPAAHVYVPKFQYALPFKDPDQLGQEFIDRAAQSKNHDFKIVPNTRLKFSRKK